MRISKDSLCSEIAGHPVAVCAVFAENTVYLRTEILVCHYEKGVLEIAGKGAILALHQDSVLYIDKMICADGIQTEYEIATVQGGTVTIDLFR